ncbi:phospholipase D family protein [Chondromyces apiculatus DSM 436]|uniref:Phospholipase D family protein n=1 Tax=Chondromyces apiculatus DSM 436 TaxID=1192034 RepID=A0A017SZH1_9BACT|nr:phospholipase D family protein [Chondromyces apiculatus DSM 436]
MAQDAAPSIELVESWPAETTLDQPDIPDASEVWKAMIRGATRALDIAQFYISDAPGSRLGPVLREVEAAAARGVAVRVLVDETFRARYPESVERLARQPGIAVRHFDGRQTMGGVLHAKYFLVDGREVYLGSQNFDWRALEHIHEVGLRVRSPAVASTFASAFALDWALAGGAPVPSRGAPQARGSAPVMPVDVLQDGETVRLWPVGSPEGFLPDDLPWDLPRLRGLIDGAKQDVQVQLLTYRPASRDGAPFLELDRALRQAAARGVTVRLLVADWSKRKDTIEGLQRLAEVPGIEVKMTTIPRWSGGFVPFARVTHAKYLVVDGRVAWVGTSNWEGDYFTKSRNVGLIVEGGAIPRRLDRLFLDLWRGRYVEAVDPRATYTPPRIDSDAPPTPASP